ncbi:3-oxoacyl-[acyl-carrier-protein] reductase FabG [Lachnellula suecica]|uniref:3-oxoacyl-[acyl-carrier-protein] reductase FabG n=1 Tax=Lachnellula suecica TaxID=602035 RepID=A0A8T9CC94_9HELO|nr:3-oxoacyl-[acyl-carrier-protein] reductase FabG [Lachnellula suecica]
MASHNQDNNAEITPIQYDPECPFKYNNFVYLISLPSPITEEQAKKCQPLQPGCAALPVGATQLIFRLTNSDADGINKHTRVENEVASISLASAALSHFKPHVVPSVYAWGSAAVRQGWIIQEFMPGSPVDEAFTTMDLQQKRQIFAQMAKMLKGLQDYKLPESITGFGGVTFDDTGRIISAAMTSVGAGPWTSYEAFFKARLEIALKKADENPHIRGWQSNGLRNRLDDFVERGLPAQFESLLSKEDRVIVHADFTTNNILFDSTSGKITGLIDYDFACILHPSYEFIHSSNGLGGKFEGWSSDDASEDMALREAKLHGFPTSLPQTTENGIQWEIAEAWENELEILDVLRPRTMPGIDKVADVDAVLGGILPWRLTNSDILRMQSEKERIFKVSQNLTSFSNQAQIRDKPDDFASAMASSAFREQDLAGKVAVITGASRGIGRAIAMNLASRGCSILGTCSSVENIKLIEALDQEIDGLFKDASQNRSSRVKGICADIFSSNCAEVIADAVTEYFAGRVDIFVNNAADADTGILGGLTVQEIQKSLLGNIQTPVLIVEGLVKRKMFRPDSRIIYISSIRSRQPWSMQLMYAAGKSAGESLCRTWAQAFGGREEKFAFMAGTTANAVSVGLTHTDWVMKCPPETLATFKDEFLPLQSLPRLGQPEEVADVVGILVSRDARWISGTVVSASGGGLKIG